MLAVLVALVIATSATPPDIVRTKDGGFMRGTISELVPGQYVVLTLPNGETRRIEMDKVDYAGPDTVQSEEAPGGPKTKPKPTGVKLHLTSPHKKARFYLPIGTRIGKIQTSHFESPKTVRTDEFKELCEAPCDVLLDPGSYELALGIDGDEPIRSDAQIDLVTPMKVEGVYNSYGVVRGAGYVVSAVGLAVGIILVINPPVGPEDGRVTFEKILPGALTIIGTGIIGGLLTRIEDDAEMFILE